MPLVQKFSRSMVETYLKQSGDPFLTDRDGDFVIQYSYDESAGCSWRVYFMVQGDRSDILSVQVSPDKKYPRSQWGQILTLCNKWNREKRWPKAYLIGPDTADEEGVIVVEHQIKIESGIHQEFVNEFCSMIDNMSYVFVKWLHEEYGL